MTIYQPHNFQRKWSYLALVKDTSSIEREGGPPPSIAELVGTSNMGLSKNSDDPQFGGYQLHCYNGVMISSSDDPNAEPFAVYGKIYGRWSDLGARKSPIGLPLCDERDIAPNEGKTGGRCQVFEFGHM